MGFTVTKLSQELVVPADPIPSVTLPLSCLDRYPTQRALIGSFHVFKQGQELCMLIRSALARALLFYYPLTGRLVEPDDEEVQVACTGEGVWFIEAAGECSQLEDVNHLEHPFMIPKEELLPYPTPKRAPTPPHLAPPAPSQPGAPSGAC